MKKPRAEQLSILAIAVLVSCQTAQPGVERISPTIGLMAGGEKISLYGHGFKSHPIATIYLGNHRVFKMGVISDTEMWFNTPRTSEPDVVDVRVVMTDGTEYLLSSGFEYMRKNRLAECVNISRKLNGTFDETD